ncbi:MAG: RNA-binding protein [Pseudomonadota bacterium]
MTRGGARRTREGPERRCIATGQSGETVGLIRFVVGPDGTVLPDLAEKLPGRGIWVSARREALDRAVKRSLFARAARAEVTVAPELTDRVTALLIARLIDLIGMARKAGGAVAGFEKVRARLASGPAGALIEAFDGSAQGKAKLRPLAADVPRITALSSAELGLAFARDRVIHAALDAGGLTERVLRDAARLSGLRMDGLGEGSSDHLAGGGPARKE